LRPAALEGLGGDLVGEVADRELVGAEEVLVVGSDEGAGEFLDLGVGGLADGLREGLGFGELIGGELGGEGMGRPRWQG
jgi:hypothetical protein